LREGGEIVGLGGFDMAVGINVVTFGTWYGEYHGLAVSRSLGGDSFGVASRSAVNEYLDVSGFRSFVAVGGFPASSAVVRLRGTGTDMIPRAPVPAHNRIRNIRRRAAHDQPDQPRSASGRKPARR
jgi:hypothetical protein